MKKYMIQGAIGVALALFLTWYRYTWFEAGLQSVVRAASDGFCVVGFLYVAVAILGKISGTGFFDIMSYGAREAVRFIVPGMTKENGKFYDYRVEKDEKRAERAKKDPNSKNVRLIIGIVLFVIGVIFTALFYAV